MGCHFLPAWRFGVGRCLCRDALLRGLTFPPAPGLCLVPVRSAAPATSRPKTRIFYQNPHPKSTPNFNFTKPASQPHFYLHFPLGTVPPPLGTLPAQRGDTPPRFAGLKSGKVEKLKSIRTSRARGSRVPVPTHERASRPFYCCGRDSIPKP